MSGGGGGGGGGGWQSDLHVHVGLRVQCSLQLQKCLIPRLGSPKNTGGESLVRFRTSTSLL